VEVVELKSWEEFENALSSFYNDVEALKVKRKPIMVSIPLFRGHVDASWKLETTLDRVTKSDYLMKEYHNLIRAVRPAVISITGKSRDLPDSFDDDQGNPKPPPGYEFMIYLRHHGFPSPLLDWSRSPYVAAYFAFHSKGNPSDNYAAVYSYVEYVGEAKSWKGSHPTIFGLGPYVISHSRHYSQQCEYTICKKNGPNGYVYCGHKQAIAEDTGRVKKYVLPKSERGKALRKLEIMNISAFSLFGSEERLMETLAYKELEKRILQ